MGKSKQPEPAGGPPKAVSAKDVLQAIRIAAIAVLSWITPSSGWPRLSVILGAIDQRIRSGETKRQVENIASKLDDRSAVSALEIVRDSTAAIYEDRLQLLREYRPGGWQPEMDIIGEEHLQAGLARGKGVILWVSYLAYSCHITKKSLKNARYDVTHLSRPDHGFSSTKLGIQILNPIQTRIEERFLHERVVIGEEGRVLALMKLHACLRRNGVVSITVGKDASEFVSAPFLNGTILFPTGPTDLARLTDSVLLPVYTVRDSYWRYTTHIGSPLTSQNETAEDAAKAFAAWIEPVVRERPAHWRNWDLMEASDTPS
jgi:lauroyl/myristoyl acyltransferase